MRELISTGLATLPFAGLPKYAQDDMMMKLYARSGLAASLLSHLNKTRQPVDVTVRLVGFCLYSIRRGTFNDRTL